MPGTFADDRRGDRARELGDLFVRVAGRERHEDVDAALARGLRDAGQLQVLEQPAHDDRPLRWPARFPCPLAGSRSKRIQSGCSRLAPREDHMCTVSTDICASQRSESTLSTTRCLHRPALRRARRRLDDASATSGASLPMFWWNHDGLSMPWFQCSSASGRSRERAQHRLGHRLVVRDESALGDAVARIEHAIGIRERHPCCVGASDLLPAFRAPRPSRSRSCRRAIRGTTDGADGDRTSTR